MDNHEINNGRRRLLTLAASGAEGVVTLGMATPFVASFFPSEKVKAAGAVIEIDVSKIESGQVMTAEWQDEPIWVVDRTAQQLKDLKTLSGAASDPKSEAEQQPKNCRNETRSIKPNIFVAVGVCTRLDCSPAYRPDIALADLGLAWKNDFFCPCHGSKFDMAGRMYKGVPAPINLVIPPYKYLSDTTVLVGEA